jgi:hypothetical protein
MTLKELLIQEIEASPDELLAQTLNFLRFLKLQTQPEISTSAIYSQDLVPIIRGSTAEDLLKFAGTWHGDDFEECLQLVYETRSPAEF